jgi:hypothetical protein
MSKNLLIMSAAVALSLPWVGCGKSDKLARHPAFTPPGGPRELKLKWPKGEQIVEQMDIKEHSELSVPGRSIPVRQDISISQQLGLTVLNESPDGEHEVEMEFLSARVEVPPGSKTLSNYDSAEKSPADDMNPVAKMFGKIIGSKVQFFLNAGNDVERIEGADVLAQKLEAVEQANRLEHFKNFYSEGFLKQMIMANRSARSKPVQPGDTWPAHIELVTRTAGAICVDDNFTLQSWENHGGRNCARLEFKGTITNKPGTSADPARMSVDSIAGRSWGVSWFDLERGLVLETTVKHDMSLVITMPVNPEGSADAAARVQQLTEQMNQTINAKLISVRLQ